MNRGADIWIIVCQWVSAHGDELKCSLASFVMTILRATYVGRKTWRRRFIEGGMCALFAFSIRDGLALLGLNADWASLLSVFVGFLGVDCIRQLADKRLGLSDKE
ncbi:phage holin, lambda family [Escherichia coli]|nr:phage holin, lambda family [Escherichia coli]MCQ1632899.1 phage holin, lambda family [Escherichia coli]